ncbi:hypothetical protein [Serratia sp. P2ACOL2]|uniref:hypothetical protein n=1 Tax=Serratia sp. P2ACOL2 TaxID=2482769 RepID=UPI000EFCC54F|nr:hypothetical protein [Serratia sp. P2ACOL2]AYO38478.1 hypothetical protein EBA31_14740 [Serratia sp. P2ACOL2]
MALTQEQQATYYMMKGAISELPLAERKLVDKLHKQVSNIIKGNEELGVVAITLVVLEASKGDKE